mmetsp:Transcript_25439/g.95868  ORF Transcript_25439/g.95868 Transcript_25439/m.95868 type:complete len:226 (+) Transcript_25439:2674-3351(+)
MDTRPGPWRSSIPTTVSTTSIEQGPRSTRSPLKMYLFDAEGAPLHWRMKKRLSRWPCRSPTTVSRSPGPTRMPCPLGRSRSSAWAARRSRSATAGCGTRPSRRPSSIDWTADGAGGTLNASSAMVPALRRPSSNTRATVPVRLSSSRRALRNPAPDRCLAAISAIALFMQVSLYSSRVLMNAAKDSARNRMRTAAPRAAAAITAAALRWAVNGTSLSADRGTMRQ